MSSEEKSPMEKATTLLRELEVRELSDAEKYEKCETISELAPREVVDLIEDPQVKEGVTWLNKAHKNISVVTKWRKAFAQTIQLLFKEVGGIDRVKKWHELEQVCGKISEEELKNVDNNLREAITWVQHIHNNSLEEKLGIMRRINNEIDCF